eukprot:1194943-Pyramimonas_sp.AAC.1
MVLEGYSGEDPASCAVLGVGCLGLQTAERLNEVALLDAREKYGKNRARCPTTHVVQNRQRPLLGMQLVLLLRGYVRGGANSES